jgi:GNAT superfamily N-acetyltransferase
MNNNAGIIELREFRAEDFQSVMDLFSPYHLEFSDHDHTYFIHLTEYVLKYGDEGDLAIVVAFVDHEIIGSVCVGIDQHSDTYSFIEWIVVKQGFQRQGVGQKLIAAAMQWARTEGCQYIWLKTVDTTYNAGTKQFYCNLGFHIAGTLPSYYLGDTQNNTADESCVLFFRKLE